MRISYIFLVLSFSFLSPASPSVPFWQSSLLPSSSSPVVAQKISVHGVPNAGKVSDSLFRGAQPDLSNLNELKKLGVTTIVDLRSESRHTRDLEQLQAESLGIHFISIPVDGFAPPTSEQLAEFFTVLRQAPLQKVFVHCRYGEDRTGVFVAAYRIAFDRWTSDQALTEMLYFGFNRHWHPAMVSYVRSLPDRVHSDPTLKSSLGN
jgi:tyrosine-protein phosphatase SIW14